MGAPAACVRGVCCMLRGIIVDVERIEGVNDISPIDVMDQRLGWNL